MKISTTLSQEPTILIVDDQEDGRALLEKILFPLGYQLAFVGSGAEALATARQLRPDLILLKGARPNGAGFQLCRQFRADPYLAEVPLLWLADQSDQATRLEGLQAGIDDFIASPFDPLELQARVQTITRLNASHRLLVERAKFEQVMEHTPDGYLIIDEQDTISYANRPARFYLNLPLDPDKALSGKFLILARHHYTCEPASAWLAWPSLPEDNVPRYLIRPETDFSNPFWLRVTTIKLPPASGKNEFIIQLHDVTTEMSLQNDMNSFHSTISHKLRTPLISMVSSLELLADYAPRLSTAEIIEFAQIALAGVQRMRSQIEDIVQYLNRPLDSSKSNFDLARLQPILTRLEDNLDLKPVQLSLTQPLDGVLVRASPKTMELILWELLENAKKFHPHRNPQVELKIWPNGPSQINLAIADDGVHLSPEQLRQLLTPYYQGEKLFTGEVPGMGLGLASVAAVMWNIGGACQVYNRADKAGLVVELTLPLASLEATRPG
jgi:DNA-binding response OmpR family regulator